MKRFFQFSLRSLFWAVTFWSVLVCVGTRLGLVEALEVVLGLIALLILLTWFHRESRVERHRLAALLVVGTLSGINKPQVWVERQDAERAWTFLDDYEDRTVERRTIRAGDGFCYQPLAWLLLFCLAGPPLFLAIVAALKSICRLMGWFR